MSRLPLRVAEPRRPERVPGHGAAGMQNLAILVVVVAALYFGRDIFVPMALALLLSFALAPLVTWLRRRKVPRIPAVIGVVLLAFLAIFGFGVVVTEQIAQLAGNLPSYQWNIEQKIKSLRSGATGSGIVERTSEMLAELGEQIEGDDAAVPDEDTSAAGSEQADEPEPMPVRVVPGEPEPLEIVQGVLGPLLGPLATGGIAIVFVIFMLLQREDLRDRFIRLAGSGDLHRTTQALGDAAKRVARYLLMQLVVNATYGVPVGIGLWLIGVPNPLLWGMMAVVLRFVPYIGPIIAAFFPLALSVAVDPSWTMFMWTAALFVVLELFSNNVVEPWLYGSSTGLSPVAIIAAAIFWTWLWGPIGLLLSTPLTVCLVVLGHHVPRFGFLGVLLGSEPVLSPQESLYQRLLAGDPDEATERAEEFLEKNTLLAFYEQVAIPALALTEQDRASGALDDERRALVAAGALTLVDNLSEHEDAPAPDAPASDTGTAPAERAEAPSAEPETVRPDRPVLCAGGRGNLDDAAAAMLAQILDRQGIGVRVVSFDAMAPANSPGLDLDGVLMVCLSYMNTDSLAHARFAIRRLRRRTAAPILVGFWSTAPEETARLDVLGATHANLVATSLEEAVKQVLAFAHGAVLTGGPAVRSGDGPPQAAGRQPAVPPRLEAR